MLIIIQENGYATEASAASESILHKCMKAYAGDNTSKCQNTLVEVLVSEKFVMLCDILFRNFRVKDYRRYIDLTKIHYRMKNGLYEKAPQSFLRDILQVCRLLSWYLLPDSFSMASYILIHLLLILAFFPSFFSKSESGTYL